MNKISPLVRLLSTCALLCSALLLLSNLQFLPAWTHAWQAVHSPLALAGAAYALPQIRLRPNRRTLFKRLLLAGTFLLWAIDQLLPPGRFAMVLGDIVVAAYVLDLFWIIQEQDTQVP